MNIGYKFLILVFCVLLQACAGGDKKPPEDLLSLTDAQMKIRSYQSRTFDISDQQKAMRGVIAALLDLGFIVERVNGPMGLVTAGKFAGSNFSGFIELTVMLRPKGEDQIEIRVNALFNTRPMEDPKAYQNFFTAVQRSLFLPG